jgi:hypothetical protein
LGITGFCFGLFNLTEPLSFGAACRTYRASLLPFSGFRIGGIRAKLLQCRFLFVRRRISALVEIQVFKPTHLF